MRLPHRKPVVSITTEHLNNILSPHYGEKGNTDSNFNQYGYVGAGWNDILLRLHENIIVKNPNYRIFQIKEKFGTLRFYTDSLTEEAYKYVEDAEKASARTCEECGREGTLRTNRSWLKTLCDIDSRIDKFNVASWRVRRGLMSLGWRVVFAINRQKLKLRNQRRSTFEQD
jgi:hypothetical protein